MTKKKKPVLVHAFSCHDLLLTIPRGDLAKTEFLTRRKRVLPNGYDEAIAKFETELTALTGGATLTPETWGGKGNLKKQANLKAAAAVLLTFGVSHYPVPETQEAQARALGKPKTEIPA
jgi:hypothetical protein